MTTCTREHNYTVEDAQSALYCDTDPEGALEALAEAGGDGTVVAEHESDVPDSNGPGAAYCPAESERIGVLAALRASCAAAGITAESPSGLDAEAERLAALERADYDQEG
jgi:hypothetical protein